MNEPDLKLVLVGDKCVGKTSVFNRFVYNEMYRTQMTIGAYFALKPITIGDQEFKLAIWDTAGEEKFDALTKFYLRGAHCALICFDLTQRGSFFAVKKWAELLEENCAIAILGNKKDLVDKGEKKRQITPEEAMSYAVQIGALYFETSAVSGENIQSAFQDIVDAYIKKYGAPKKNHGYADLDNADFSEKKICC